MESSEQEQFYVDVPLQPRMATKTVPLLPIQLTLFRQKQEKGGLSNRMCAAALRVRGPFDAELVGRSLEAIVLRHESLRTRMVLVNGSPVQHIDPPDNRNPQVIRVAASSPAEIEIRAALLAQEFVDTKIDLTKGPLFESRLLQLSDADHILIVLVDHMVSDAASCRIINSEFWTLYNQAVHGLPFSLPSLPIQLADYAVWTERTHDSWLAKHAAYWRERLSNVHGVVIPRDPGLVEADQAIGATVHFPLGKKVSERLRELALAEGKLLPLVVLVVHAVTMSRWCNRDDLLIGFVSHGRYGRPELRTMVGYLASLLYLRIDVSGNRTLLDVLETAGSEFSAACEHQDFGRLTNMFPEAATEVIFNWVPSERAVRSVGIHPDSNSRLRITPFPIRFAWPHKFSVFFSDSPAGIGMTVHYRPDMLNSGTIQRFANAFKRIAAGFVQDPKASVASASVADDEQPAAGGRDDHVERR